MTIKHVDSKFLVPEAAARNRAILYESGGDARNKARKGAERAQPASLAYPVNSFLPHSALSFHVSYESVTNEGTQQALRNLVELGAIQLVGRLLKIPYWTCLPAPKSEAYVNNEGRTWFGTMRKGGEDVLYVKRNLKNWGYYKGEVGPRFTDELRAAVNAYRRNNALSPGARIDDELFMAMLDPGRIPERGRQSADRYPVPPAAYLARNWVRADYEPKTIKVDIQGRPVADAAPPAPKAEKAEKAEAAPPPPAPQALAIADGKRQVAFDDAIRNFKRPGTAVHARRHLGVPGSIVPSL